MLSADSLEFNKRKSSIATELEDLLGTGDLKWPASDPVNNVAVETHATPLAPSMTVEGVPAT